MKKKIFLISFFTLVLASLIIPRGASAQINSIKCGLDGINTAVGCVPVLDSSNGISFVNWVLKWALGLGGGFAFLLILYAGFMIMTSAGNPERLKAGQELLTSAISGILLLIFSVVILNLIGINILRIFK